MRSNVFYYVLYAFKITIMTIKFRNETELEITQEVANILQKRILEGCSNWQIFSDEKGEPFLFINISDINAIVR